MSLSRLLSLPLELLVRAYQLLVSPLIPPSCRFYPSCSAYALTALRRFGPVRGSWLAVRRVSRCHPWNPGGVDHVPVRGADGHPLCEADDEPASDTKARSPGRVDELGPRVDTVMPGPGDRQGTIGPGS